MYMAAMHTTRWLSHRCDHILTNCRDASEAQLMSTTGTPGTTLKQFIKMTTAFEMQMQAMIKTTTAFEGASTSEYQVKRGHQMKSCRKKHRWPRDPGYMSSVPTQSVGNCSRMTSSTSIDEGLLPMCSWASDRSGHLCALNTHANKNDTARSSLWKSFKNT